MGKFEGSNLAIDEATWAGRQQNIAYGLWAPDLF
jgi:hypothetical protein